MRLSHLGKVLCWMAAGVGFWGFQATFAENKSSLPPKPPVQLDVPFEKQETSRQCGLAAAKMIAGYYRQDLKDAQVEWLKTASAAGEGILGSELVTVFRAAGYETAVFQGTLDREKKEKCIFYHLDKKRPLIVMITSKDKKSSHYDVVTGYDPEKSTLFLLDPAIGPVTIDGRKFSVPWLMANFFTMVVVPKKLLKMTPTPTR